MAGESVEVLKKTRELQQPIDQLTRGILSSCVHWDTIEYRVSMSTPPTLTSTTEDVSWLLRPQTQPPSLPTSWFALKPPAKWLACELNGLATLQLFVPLFSYSSSVSFPGKILWKRKWARSLWEKDSRVVFCYILLLFICFWMELLGE